MAIIFSRKATRYLRFLVIFAMLSVGFSIWGIWYWFSPAFTDVGYRPRQPIPFSHRLHVGRLGLDCRYCHSTVEQSNKARLPSTYVCMGCHSTILPKSPKLSLLIKSFRTGEAIPWVKVHRLPDYVYFDHSAHIAAGVGCESCHGRIDRMEVVYQAKTLSMSWCLSCHRRPNEHLRPLDKVTVMNWVRGRYRPNLQEPFRKKRLDIKRLREALRKETGSRPVRMAGKTWKKLSEKRIREIVVNPPEHCSGCHR